MKRVMWEPVEPYWPTIAGTGQVAQLSDKPGRRRKRVPFGFQPPKPKAPK